jgi:hypothetical protein
MPVYEILFPGVEGGKNKVAKIRGDSWMGALKSGLAKLGDRTDVTSLMCDVKKQGMVVTDPKSGRVFRIREVSDPNAPSLEVAEGMGRGKAPPARPVEEVLGELFGKTQDIYNESSLEGAANFVLSLAAESIPHESAAVLIADINDNDMYFAAASGPKAKEIMSFRVPMGQGIAGFSAVEGVALAVSDVQEDERFFADISDKLGYETRSLLCSPCQKEGRIYAVIELVNKNTTSSFTADEVNVLNFLAHEFASYLINTGQTGD